MSGDSDAKTEWGVCSLPAYLKREMLSLKLKRKVLKARIREYGPTTAYQKTASIAR